MRIKLSDTSLRLMFGLLKAGGYTIKSIAPATGYSTRTVTDWKSGLHTMPQESFRILKNIISMSDDKLVFDIYSDWEHTKKAGKNGGTAFIKRYGKLGTAESRKKGGNVSYEKRAKNREDIYAQKIIKTPPKSSVLFAEFIGIMIGDGSITHYQASISMNMVADCEYAIFIAKVAEGLFGITPTITHRKTLNRTVITMSSVRLVGFLHRSGLPIGHKLRAGLDIPEWIKEKRRLSGPCVRGIFDTDGCIFVERHKKGDKTYEYARMSFVSASEQLVDSIYNILLEMGFSPKKRYRRVNLERFTDIKRYFTIIRSSNPKHTAKFLQMERSHSG